MAGKRFFPIHFESIQCREYDDFIVQTLTGQPFAVRRQRNRRHRVHRWIRNVFHIDRNVPFPNAHTFVIGCGDEPTILVDERNRIDGAQMSIVLLHNVTATNVPLKQKILK